MKFILYASDVAAAAGLNRYKSPEEILTKNGLMQPPPSVYDQIPQEVFQTLGSGNHDSAENAVLHIIKQAGESVNETEIHQKIVQACNNHRVQEIEQKMSKCPSKQKALEQALSFAKKGLNTDGTPIVDPVNLKLEVASVSNKCMGSREEAPATNKYEQEHGIKVTDRNTVLHIMRLEIGQHQFEIRGRIDGLQDNGKTLVEVKNRKNRLFDMIPTRERVQMEVYMRMPLLQLNKSVLVQNHKRSGASKSTPYYRDNALWDRVRKGLNRYAELSLANTSCTS